MPLARHVLTRLGARRFSFGDDMIIFSAKKWSV